MVKYKSVQEKWKKYNRPISYEEIFIYGPIKRMVDNMSQHIFVYIEYRKTTFSLRDRLESLFDF